MTSWGRVTKIWLGAILWLISELNAFLWESLGVRFGCNNCLANLKPMKKRKRLMGSAIIRSEAQMPKIPFTL